MDSVKIRSGGQANPGLALVRKRRIAKKTLVRGDKWVFVQSWINSSWIQVRVRC